MSALPCTYGRYLLLEELARGGMAVVYRAVLRERSGFEKQVALKRVLRELSTDAEFIARFADEARIASTLNHNNIVQVFDFGQVEGEYFLAMELIDGANLATVLARCQEQQRLLPLPAALYIAAEAARGLGAAHRRLDEHGVVAPVIHRDVSPQNILLSRHGGVKVADFGIAKASERLFRTRTGLVLGKCRYLAPEQAAAGRVTPTADVFATGCVLFEMLTGRPLFDGASSSAIMRQVTAETPAPPSRANPALPTELDELLARCLARDPEARHPDGMILAGEIEALLHRLAPDFTCDEIAKLLEAYTPPRTPGQNCHTAATLHDAPLTTSQPLADATTLPLASLATAPTVLAAGRETATPTSAMRPSRRPTFARRAVLLASTAALLGALGGLALRWQQREGSLPLALRAEQPRTCAGWSLRLLGLEQRSPALLGIKLELQAPGTLVEGAIGGLFSVLGHPAVLWSVSPAPHGLELHLVFAARGQRGLPLLSFYPPGGGKLVFRLQQGT